MRIAPAKLSGTFGRAGAGESAPLRAMGPPARALGLGAGDRPHRAGLGARHRALCTSAKRYRGAPPRRAPSVTALQELRRRMPGLRYLGIIVDTGTAERLPAAERFLDNLAARIEHYPPNLVAAVRTGIGPERRSSKRTRRSTSTSPTWRRSAIKSKRPATRPSAATWGSTWKTIGRVSRRRSTSPKSRANTELENRTPSVFPPVAFPAPTRSWLSSSSRRPEFTTGTGLGRELLKKIEQDIADIGGIEHYAPGMRFGYTGDIAINVEELTALEQDLVVASGIVLVLVLAAVVAFYRWWASAWALLLPLAVATIGTFGLVTLPPFGVTGLNSNTAFLGSVIVGNGVNFGHHSPGSLRRRAPARTPHRGCVVLAVAGSRKGTFAAALAASASYGALVLTEFRGFNQFGIIGGLGMLLSWGATFVLGPPLIAWLDRDGGSVRRRPAGQQSWMSKVADLVTHHHVAVLLGACVVTVAAGVKLKGIGRDWIEYDFSQLRRADTHRTGEAYWGRKMDDLVGPLPHSAGRPHRQPRAGQGRRATVTARQQRAPTFRGGGVDPSRRRSRRPNQNRKIAVVGEIRRDLTPRVRARMTPEQRGLIDRYLGNGPLEPVRPEDLPESVTAGLRERDGAINRAVLVYPRPSRALWQGASIVGLTSSLRSVVEATLDPPGRLASQGRFHCRPILSLRSARWAARHGGRVRGRGGHRRADVPPHGHDAAHLGVAAPGGDVALWRDVGARHQGQFLQLRRLSHHVRDWRRVCRQHHEPRAPGPRAIRRRCAPNDGRSGRSLPLTTIIGYGSLLFAQNRALFSFGAVAVLGEIACLATAIVVLPAILLGKGAPRAVAGSLPDPRT